MSVPERIPAERRAFVAKARRQALRRNAPLTHEQQREGVRRGNLAVDHGFKRHAFEPEPDCPVCQMVGGNK